MPKEVAKVTIVYEYKVTINQNNGTMDLDTVYDNIKAMTSCASGYGIRLRDQETHVFTEDY